MIEGIRRNRTVGDLDLISEVDKVYEANITRAQKVDGALADVQAAIKKMVAAHAALASPSSPNTSEQIQSFIAFAGRAAAAIEAAQKKPQ